MNLEELIKIDTDDVGQKRYVMYQAFDRLVEKLYDLSEKDVPEPDERVRELKNFDGYMYKLAQDFLTSSSTHEKEERLEKMRDHVSRKTGNE